MKGVWGVAVDGTGNVYFSEGGRVRKVTMGAALTVSVGGTAMQSLLARGHHHHGQVQQAVLARRHRLGDDPRTEHVFGLSRATAKLAAGKRTRTAPIARQPS